MLSIAAVRSAGGAAGYFAKDNYYTLEESSEASSWAGEGSADLGLSGDVGKEGFEKILNGELPDGEKVGQVENRRPGLDMTFSMPKSASVMAYIAGDKRILAAHMEAVKATMSWVERTSPRAAKISTGARCRSARVISSMLYSSTTRAARSTRRAISMLSSRTSRRCPMVNGRRSTTARSGRTTA